MTSLNINIARLYEAIDLVEAFTPGDKSLARFDIDALVARCRALEVIARAARAFYDADVAARIAPADDGAVSVYRRAEQARERLYDLLDHMKD